MKKLISMRWYLFAAVLITAVLDLIGLGTIDKYGKQWNVGLGFILAFVIFVLIMVYTWKNWDEIIHKK